MSLSWGEWLSNGADAVAGFAPDMRKRLVEAVLGTTTEAVVEATTEAVVEATTEATTEATKEATKEAVRTVVRETCNIYEQCDGGYSIIRGMKNATSGECDRFVTDVCEQPVFDVLRTLLDTVIDADSSGVAEALANGDVSQALVNGTSSALEFANENPGTSAVVATAALGGLVWKYGLPRFKTANAAQAIDNELAEFMQRLSTKIGLTAEQIRGLSDQDKALLMGVENRYLPRELNAIASVLRLDTEDKHFATEQQLHSYCDTIVEGCRENGMLSEINPVLARLLDANTDQARRAKAIVNACSEETLRFLNRYDADLGTRFIGRLNRQTAQGTLVSEVVGTSVVNVDMFVRQFPTNINRAHQLAVEQMVGAVQEGSSLRASV